MMGLRNQLAGQEIIYDVMHSIKCNNQVAQINLIIYLGKLLFSIVCDVIH